MSSLGFFDALRNVNRGDLGNHKLQCGLMCFLSLSPEAWKLGHHLIGRKEAGLGGDVRDFYFGNFCHVSDGFIGPRTYGLILDSKRQYDVFYSDCKICRIKGNMHPHTQSLVPKLGRRITSSAHLNVILSRKSRNMSDCPVK